TPTRFSTPRVGTVIDWPSNESAPMVVVLGSWSASPYLVSALTARPRWLVDRLPRKSVTFATINSAPSRSSDVYVVVKVPAPSWSVITTWLLGRERAEIAVHRDRQLLVREAVDVDRDRGDATVGVDLAGGVDGFDHRPVVTVVAEATHRDHERKQQGVAGH